MRPSFQTVGIVIGVTIVHLLIISAFSPAKNEPAVPRPQIVLAPELQSLLEADATHLALDESAKDASASPTSSPLEEAVALPESVVPPESLVRPAPKLAETEEAPDPDPTGEKPAQKRPPAAIRGVRKISPLPRS